jgi:hypothetical protein
MLDCLSTFDFDGRRGLVHADDGGLRQFLYSCGVGLVWVRRRPSIGSTPRTSSIPIHSTYVSCRLIAYPTTKFEGNCSCSREETALPRRPGVVRSQNYWRTPEEPRHTGESVPTGDSSIANSVMRGKPLDASCGRATAAAGESIDCRCPSVRGPPERRIRALGACRGKRTSKDSDYTNLIRNVVGTTARIILSIGRRTIMW